MTGEPVVEFTPAPTAVPGMRITYQITIGDGRTIAYEAAVDSTIDRRDLDELLDRCGGAAERRQAVFELPLVKANLWTNRHMLVQQRKDRAVAQAAANARTMQVVGSRRNPPPPAAADVNALAQFDNRIMQIERQIKNDELRIPYLEAIIAGREPPELFPDAEDERMAAE